MKKIGNYVYLRLMYTIIGITFNNYDFFNCTEYYFYSNKSMYIFFKIGYMTKEHLCHTNYNLFFEIGLVTTIYDCITLHTICIIVVCCRCDNIFRECLTFMKSMHYYSSNRTDLCMYTNQ